MKTNLKDLKATFRQMANPYQSPEFIDHAELPFRVPSWIGLTVWLYPVLFLAAIYGTWCIAWIVLGHQPRPSLDDPKSISWLVDVSYVVAVVFMIGFPVAALGGIVIQFLVVERSWAWRSLLVGLLTLLWFATIMLLRWDPLNVVTWFMD